MGPGPPQHQLNAETQRGLSTPAPRSRDKWLPDIRDSGVGTGGTYGPGLTSESWVPDGRGCRREFGLSGRMGPGPPQHQLNAETQRGLSTPAPRSRDKWLPDIRDSGVGTGGTYGPGLTSESWVPDGRRLLRGRGVDASTPMPGGKDWPHERRVRQYSPIRDGQLSQSLTRKMPWDPGNVGLLPKMGI